MVNFRSVYIGLLVVAWGSWIAADSSAELLQLHSQDGLYNLVAREVPLADILRRIEVLEGVAIREFGGDNRLVSARFNNVSLDQMLTRLGVSYALIYARDASGSFRLTDALMLEPDSMDLTPEQRAHVLRLIRDLRDDDIRGNAHRAVRELYPMVCQIIPFLEDALYFDDYQGRQLAAQLLRSNCEEYVPSDRMLEVTMDLLSQHEYNASEYWSLFAAGSAFSYLRARPELAPRVRYRLAQNLNSDDGQERFLSAALLAGYGESGLARDLVRLLAPHLMDNDIPTDGGVAAHSLYQLGSAILPYLAPYRHSSDIQQAELAELIYSSLVRGEVQDFDPAIYVNTYRENPLRDAPYFAASRSNSDQYPDKDGIYHNLSDRRLTRRQVLGVDPRPPRQTIKYYTPADWQYEVENEYFRYTVRSGDTVQSIAEIFVISVDEILESNDLLEDVDTLLQSGATVLIPPMSL